MNNYTKINEMLHFSDIHPVDCRFILSYISELEKENEKLNHYKLLYQKVKERNMEAIELIENDLSLGVSTFGSVYSIGANKVLEILKGNNEE